MNHPSGVERPLWAEGILLGQQHFQSWDRYIEASQITRTAALSPHVHGLMNLEVDEEALERGSFRLRRCQMFMPDGRLVSFDENVDGSAETSLLELGPGGGRVYAVLAANDKAMELPGYGSADEQGAWKPRFRETPDAHDPERTREVMFASANIVLSINRPTSSSTVHLPIAEVERLDDVAFRMSRDFIPASCRLDTSQGLMDLLDRNLERVATRCALLRRQQAAAGRVQDFGPSEVARFLLMQTLEPAAVALRSLKANPGTHPWFLHDVLSRLVAGLSIFEQPGEDEGETTVPEYDHEDMGQVLQNLDKAVDRLIGTALPQHLSTIRLAQETESIRYVEGVESRLLDEQTLFLAVRMDGTEGMSWIDDLPKQIKIGAREELERIVASGLAGIQLVHVQRPPNRLPVKTGYEYFRLEPVGEFWERAREAGSMAVYVPGAFKEARVEMVSVQED